MSKASRFAIRKPGPTSWLTLPRIHPDGLLASGEGGMYYYRRQPEKDLSDRIAFKPMGEVQQASAELFGGTWSYLTWSTGMATD